MRIAAQLIERVNRRMASAQINEEVPDSTAIGGDGCIPQRSRHRFRRRLEELRQRMSGERTTWFHGFNGGTGRMCWATDRKSTRLNSSHLGISYAVFCLKK